jgi:siroheme synthase (precorrin-2 oxidase/ferrochelatase)
VSDKIAVVYIGDKPSKKDTITGSRLVFPRHTAVDVESHIAMQLLEFPTVWIRQEALAGELERQETIVLVAAEEQERLAAEQARLAEEQSMVVGERDLAKMTSAQLATLVEGEDLGIEPQGPQEKVPEYRVRVRDALKGKLADGQGGE